MAQQRARQGRGRYIRARRTLPTQHQQQQAQHDAGMLLAAITSSLQQGMPLRASTASLAPAVQQRGSGSMSVFGTSGFASVMMTSNSGGHTAGWQAPFVNFTMGWYEPAELGSRRTHAQRRNRSGRFTSRMVRA